MPATRTVTAAPLPYAPQAPTSPSTSSPDETSYQRALEERLDKVVQAATKQLNFVAQFIKEHPKSPKLLEYLSETATLKAAVEKGNPDDIEQKSTTLSADLARDQDYQVFDAKRAKEQKIIEAQNLSDDIQRAQVQRAFLIDYVTKNPLASEVVNFLPLIKQVDPALENPGVDQLQRLTGQIELAIREANLDDAFRNFQVDPAKPSLQIDGNNAEQNEMRLPITDKNRFLLEGDLNDVIALYNASSRAPHVAHNLRGQFVFTGDRAAICLFGDNPAGVSLIVRSKLAR